MQYHLTKNTLKLLRLSIGNAIEWYDFCLYGYFASIIATLFFPSHNPSISLLSAFAAFAAGFIARPIGGLIFGYLGDVKGRYFAMNLAIVTMSMATFLMAFIPDYSTLGILAPCLLVLLRLIQGISAGGQYGNLITIASEDKAFRFRGFYAGLAFSVSAIGFTLASLVSQLAISYTPEPLAHYAWRLPFLVSGLLLIVQFLTRLPAKNEDAAIQQHYQQTQRKNPLILLLRHHMKPFLLVIGLVTCGSSLYYLVYTYMVTYTVNFMHVPLANVLKINTLSLIVISVLIPIFGLLSDFLDRKRLLFAGFAVFLIGCYPIMQMLWHGYIMTSMMLMTFALAWISGLITPAYFQLFPSHVRAAGCTLGSCVGTALSGLAPLVAVAITFHSYYDLIWLYFGLLVFGCSLTVLLPIKIFTAEYHTIQAYGKPDTKLITNN